MLQQELQLELAVRNELVRYLAGEVSLSDFRNWFDAETWNSSSELATDVDRLLAEYSNGDWAEDALRKKLLLLAQSFSSNAHTWGDSGLKMTTGSSSTKLDRVSSESSVDIRLEVAS